MLRCRAWSWRSLSSSGLAGRGYRNFTTVRQNAPSMSSRRRPGRPQHEISSDPAALVVAACTAPGRQALGGMLLHPLGELRHAHQAGLHRDVGEFGGGDSLLMAIRRRGQTAEHGNDLDHARTPSPRPILVPPAAGLPSPGPLAGSAGGNTLSYIARASRISLMRSRSDFGTN